MMGLLRDHNLHAAHRGTLIMVYLSAAYRGQGGAEALLEATLNNARAAGITQVELVLSSDTPPGRSDFILGPTSPATACCRPG